MQINTVKAKETEIFRIRDRIVSDSEIEEVAKEVEKALKLGSKTIALSFLPSLYPYSPVLSVLTRCHRIAQEYGAKVCVVAPKQEFIDVLLETHLDKIFEIFNSEDELESR